ncbi:MAG: T9SS type A sorting domain-containing protein [Bacteroidetes bacterium]|nr:MAG: T9SS type A sorting domain-containing protein [Bacteroidota bacterium]
MLVRSLFPLFSLFLATSLFAQDQMFQQLTYPVNQNGKTLQYPFAGGLNAPQFSEADLNNDQIPDLVVFDRAGDVFLTFLNEGTPNTSSYRYAPEFACNFPPLQDYVLLRDYNQDGAADIFCASLGLGTQEMQVFKGYYENNMLKFSPFLFTYPGCASCVPEYIYYPSVLPGFWNNLFIADTDIPAVDDVDGDGDLDIITFDGAAGGHVWLVQNMSVEKGFGLDSLHFEVTDRCWGLFYESGLLACECDLSPGQDSCVNGFSGPPVVDDRDDTRHPGSTVMTYDQEGDGDMELVLGDISFSCLNQLVNGGTKDFAWMTEQDNQFPRYDTPVDIVIFPAAFYLDLNNDGKKDMVAAPNNKFVNEDRNGVWYYPNTATTAQDHVFELETKRFLVGDMVDAGTATHPVLVDVNADGLLDIVIGNYGYFTPGIAQNASLYLYRNTGTAMAPEFTLIDSDWQGLSEFAPNDYDFCPTFGDLDNDQDLDMLVGSNGGALYYYRNTAGAGNPMQFERDFNIMWVTMDIGSYSTPAIVDLDSDGLKDIVVGERTGELNFFKNIGAPDNPIFNSSPTLTKLGAVDTRVQFSDIGFSTPVFLEEQNGAIFLVTGTQEGHLEAYTNIVASQDPYAVVSEKWGNVDVGNRSAPTFGDLDKDGKLEMVVGNLRGGLMVFRTEMADCTTSTSTAVKPTAPEPRLYPNPASSWVRVEWPARYSVNWRISNALGQLVTAGTAPNGSFTIPVNGWQSGLYFLELRSADQVAGKTIIIAD